MAMTEEQKEWIDNATYKELLRRRRFGDSGDPLFQCDVWDYFKEVFDRRKKEVGADAACQASKELGWR